MIILRTILVRLLVLRNQNILASTKSPTFLETITKINKRKLAKSVSAFYFSTVYTKIHRSKFFDVFSNIIDFCFKGCTKRYVEIDIYGKTRWHNHKSKKLFSFPKNLLKLLSS